jgi:arsenite methyltransferase
MASSSHDQWARWLLERRHGGDEHLRQAGQLVLQQYRDAVLAHAELAAGDVVLDVGCGDGLIAFGALPLVGEHGRVIFSDISRDLLAYCRSAAEQQGLLERCAFVEASADNLRDLATASVDVVTTRSVLIFVADKQQAFREFTRVLKPGGRLSIFEPINRLTYPEPEHTFAGYDVTPVMAIANKLKAVYERIQPPASDPMVAFDERDLLHYAEQAGCVEVHLQLVVDIAPAEPAKWDAQIRSAGNPKVPTLEEAMRKVLTPEEAERFVSHFRPLVEQGRGTMRRAVAYLWAKKETHAPLG